MEQILFIDSTDRFLDWLSVNGSSENTIRAYRADLRGLRMVLPMSPLTWDELQMETARYLTKNRPLWAPKTTERKVGTFRAWAKWAGATGFLAGYRPPKPARAEPHPLPEGIDGVLRMMNACVTPSGLITPRIRRRRALVAFTGLCGLRVGEALSIRPAAVNRLERTLTVRGKGDRTRVVPISDMALPIILDAMDATPVGETIVGLADRGARQMLTGLAASAGLSRHVSSHDLRATLATAAYDKSKDLRVVQEILGHASPVQTQVYTGVSRAAMRTAMEVA